MRTRTNQGECNLTAEMVCRGMVFRWPSGPAGFRSAWVVQTNGATICPGWTEFLGCDPEIASRADCERFGVYGDAAAHGFARLRDGGAVDLRNPGNMRKGMVLWSPEWFGDGRVTLDSVSGTGEAGTWWNVRPCGGVVPTTAHRFIGLNADHASPEVVRRMCCLAPKDGDIGSAVRCTLAIGEHEQHEDLATGVKWATSSGPAIAKANIRARLDSAKGHFFTGSPDSIRRVLAACDLRADVHRLVPGSYRVTLEGADAVLCDVVKRWLSDNCPMYVMYEVASTRPTCGNCAQTITDPFPMRFAADRGDGALESALICARCAREIEPGGMTVRNGRIVPKFGPSSVDSMPEARATNAVFAEPKTKGSVERMAQHDESGVLGFCAFVAGLKRWVASPGGKRAAQERALGALVNAVPEGLDPIGWRAAVLACHEAVGTDDTIWFVREEHGRGRSIERQLRETRTPEHEPIPVAAYHRAITPAAPVPRVRATWKTRSPVLAVDDGRDE